MIAFRTTTLFAALCTAVAATAALAGGPGPATATARPPAGDAIARVNGVALERAAFADWLVATHGWRHFDDYVDLMLLREELTRAGLPAVTPADVDAAFEQDWQDQVLLRQGGTESGWLEELKKSGLDRAGYRDRRAGTLEIELLAKRILQQRPMTPDQARELHTREFGAAGLRTHVRVAFFSSLKDVKPGERVDATRAAVLEAQARARAEEFLAAVRADRASFAREVLVRGDPCTIPRFDTYPIDVRSRGGEIERLRADHFAGKLLPELADAKDGDLVGPVVTPGGLYVVELVRRETVPFETSGGELARIWRERAPSASEVVHLRLELREKARIERFPLHP